MYVFGGTELIREITVLPQNRHKNGFKTCFELNLAITQPLSTLKTSGFITSKLEF